MEFCVWEFICESYRYSYPNRCQNFLALGPKYNLPSSNIRHIDILAPIEGRLYNEPNFTDEIRDKITAIIHHIPPVHDPTLSRLGVNPRALTHFLNNSPRITPSKSRQKRCTCFYFKIWITQNMLTLLSDKSTYQPSAALTNKLNSDICALTKSWTKSKSMLRWLRNKVYLPVFCDPFLWWWRGDVLVLERR